MFHILARMTVAPADAAKARDIFTALVAKSMHDDGCVAYALYQQSDAPHVFQTVEQWRDQAASDAHGATEHVRAALAIVVPLFTTPPELLVFNKLAGIGAAA